MHKNQTLKSPKVVIWLLKSACCQKAYTNCESDLEYDDTLNN